MKRTWNTMYLFVFTICWGLYFASQCTGASLMVEKNLFAQDRKPPSPESAAPPPQPNKPGLTAKAVQLDGVFIRGDTKKAILRVKGQIPGADKSKAQNPYVTLGEGEKLGDLQVVKIDYRSVSLEKDGQVDIVKLFAEGKVVPPAPPVPASPAPSPPQAGQAPSPPGINAPGVQMPSPAAPQAAGGGTMPGAPVPPNVANPRGSHRPITPPGQVQPPEDNGVPSDEGDSEEGAGEPE